ncbi:MAG: ABC transporter ATP-binding protein, partial [Flavobacteriales bacterium]|nr:ABC transporter ATP-binding protein [Flavobacteriales bacterium]
MKPYRVTFLFGMLLLTASSLLTLVITRLWGQLGGAGTQVTSTPNPLQDLISVSFDMSLIKNIAIIVFALLLVQAVISFLRVYIFAKITENVLLTLRTDVYNKVVKMPMTFFNTQRVGDLNSRISADVTAIQDIFMTTLPELFRQFIIIAFGIGFLIYSSPQLTLVMVSTLPVMVIVAVVFGRYIRRLSKATQDKVAESNVIVQETFTGIVNVKSFANELFEIARYTLSAKEIKKYAIK